jgi:hypothetical protein
MNAARRAGITAMKLNPTLDSGKYIARDYFTYSLVTTAALPPAGSVSISQSIDTDADFFWTKSAVFVDVGSNAPQVATQEVPDVTILITDGTTGRALSNQPVALASLFGSAQLPFILPIAKYFGSRSLIQVTLANTSGGTTYSSIRLAFHGIKAFLASPTG